MKIYLDYIFIENFLVILVTLYETKKVLDINSNMKRIILASLFSSAYIIIMIFFGLDIMDYLVCKILLIQIVVYIAFKPKSIKKLIVNSVKFFVINIFNVGVIYILCNFINIEVKNILEKLSVYVSTFLIGNYTIKYFTKLLKNKSNKEIYNVELEINGKKIKYKGFLDTGNTVFSYTHNLPVIFASFTNCFIEENLKNLKSIDVLVKTITGEQEKKGYLIDKLYIKEKNMTKKAIVVFMNKIQFSDDKYNMILNNKLF